RLADVFFDSRQQESTEALAPGNGLFTTQTSNNFWGLGPHLGVQLAQHIEGSGLGVVARVDAASLFGRTHQRFAEEILFEGTRGSTSVGETRRSNPQTVPMLTAVLGIAWQPQAFQQLTVFAGYQYEYWWDVGRLSTSTSRGELSDQGVLLRAE